MLIDLFIGESTDIVENCVEIYGRQKKLYSHQMLISDLFSVQQLHLIADLFSPLNNDWTYEDDFGVIEGLI